MLRNEHIEKDINFLINTMCEQEHKDYLRKIFATLERIELYEERIKQYEEIIKSKSNPPHNVGGFYPDLPYELGTENAVNVVDYYQLHSNIRNYEMEKVISLVLYHCNSTPQKIVYNLGDVFFRLHEKTAISYIVEGIVKQILYHANKNKKVDILKDTYDILKNK